MLWKSYMRELYGIDCSSLSDSIATHKVLHDIFTIDSLSMNSNESNKKTDRFFHKSINKRYLILPSKLVACFLGKSKSGTSCSVRHKKRSASESDKSKTSIGVHSSILEPTSSRLSLGTAPVMYRIESDITPCVARPSYQHDPRFFCMMSQADMIECNSSLTDLQSEGTGRKDVVVEIDLCQSRDRPCSRQLSSVVCAAIECQSDRGRFARSILRTEGKRYKICSPLRISFAAGHKLASIFEYPSYESFHQSINESDDHDDFNSDYQNSNKNKSSSATSKYQILSTEKGFRPKLQI